MQAQAFQFLADHHPTAVAYHIFYKEFGHLFKKHKDRQSADLVFTQLDLFFIEFRGTAVLLPLNSNEQGAARSFVSAKNNALHRRAVYNFCASFPDYGPPGPGFRILRHLYLLLGAQFRRYC